MRYMFEIEKCKILHPEETVQENVVVFGFSLYFPHFPFVGDRDVHTTIYTVAYFT